MTQHSTGAGRSRRFTLRTIGAAAILLGLLMPTESAASIYIWRVNAPNSEWTNPSNWEHVASSGPIGAGYPNGVGDTASFNQAYPTPRAVVFGNVTLTVGQIFITSPTAISIVAGAGGTLLLDNGASSPIEVVVTGGSAATHLVDAPMLLRGSLAVRVDGQARLRLASIREVVAARDLTKGGTGTLELFRPNAFTGRTLVFDGILQATDFVGGPSVSGDLVVGDSAGSALSAIVFIGGPNQIPDTGRVVVNADGYFTMLAAERMGRLVINGGAVETRNAAARLTVSQLDMTGGTLFAGSGGTIDLEGPLSASSNASGPAIISTVTAFPFGRLNLVQDSVFTIADGPGALDLEIIASVSGAAGARLIKDGTGTVRFSQRAANSYVGETHVRRGRLELSGVDLAVPSDLRVGDGTGPATVALLRAGNAVSDSALVTVMTGALLQMSSGAERVQSLDVNDGGDVRLGVDGEAALTMLNLAVHGGRIAFLNGSRIIPTITFDASSSNARPAVFDGTGVLAFEGTRVALVSDDGPLPVDVRIDVPIGVAAAPSLVKRGLGTALLSGGVLGGSTRIVEGTLIMNGSQPGAVALEGGVLRGTGSVGALSTTGGRIEPGEGPGRLRTGAVALSSNTTLAVELNAPAGGTGSDQLAATGTVNLGSAVLELVGPASLPALASFTIVDNDGTDPVVGTFEGLREGDTVTADGREFAISYRGGDGNDVVLVNTTQVTYFLAEGATGSFFDEDVLIANPNTSDAPVTLTFLLEGGRTIVERRTVRAQSRLTVHVDAIPGLESATASVQVTSDDRLPLIVERTMFWDASGYGGHTANAVDRPETRWIFAEGFQGFFDTFILIANANPEATTATLTFLREGAPPVVATVPVGPFARKTVFAGDYPELRNRAFGIVVEATRPVIAERAMYFASQPGRLWSGGHANTGTVEAATEWFHAEGATGAFFSTFILLSNPNDRAASVELQFLLTSGAVVTRRKTLPARGRLTINPAAEGDARLTHASLSTVVRSDVPIVSERSMYWPGEATPFGEGHNSSGVTALATRWGLAEGRLGGPRVYDTYILLANPGTQAAQITITYLREGGAPIVRSYTVAATSRFTVDVKSDVPELHDSTFGARIEVANNVPIAVERSVYWNAANTFWAGGTNALGIPLP